MANLARVAIYRLKIKSGYFRLKMPVGKAVTGPFFKPTSKNPLISEPESPWSEGNCSGFGWLQTDIKDPPDWHRSIFNGKRHPSQDLHWSLISDFDQRVGDIKGVWELSRFDWLIVFCRKYLHTGENKWLDKMNVWLEDWSQNNPVNLGPNWKCGQEASIRILKLALASLLLKQERTPENPLVLLASQHLSRIIPTRNYALAQDNNHATSEAAALFVGGAWLANAKYGCASLAINICDKGRFLLERSIKKLIENDGTFSQYSVNYHRFMLDTLSFAEIWRRAMNIEPFSETFYRKVSNATKWLSIMTDTISGHAPNIGSNDGARIFVIDESDFTDFRSSIQLASTLFLNKKFFEEPGIYDTAPKIFGIQYKNKSNSLNSNKVFNDGGFAVLASANVKAILRFPRFRFRPCQSDILHLDFWINGENIFRDGGSYSYNCEPKLQNYFSGTASHNTVQFDDREQMPRISRFLFGEWPISQADSEIKCDNSTTQSFSVSYKDWKNAFHERSINLKKDELKVTDKISGFDRKAVLRWRLLPVKWTLNENSLSTTNITIKIDAEKSPKEIRLAEGFESQYYGKKSALPVLEVEFDRATTVATSVKWRVQ